MKKKIFLSIFLVVLLTFGISTVYANMVDSQLPTAFERTFERELGIPAETFLSAFVICTFLLGLIVLAFSLIGSETVKDIQLGKTYLVLVFILNFFQILIVLSVRVLGTLIFAIDVLSIILMMILFKLKNKDMKIIYVIITILTLFIFVIWKLFVNFIYD